MFTATTKAVKSQVEKMIALGTPTMIILTVDKNKRIRLFIAP